MNNRKIIVSFLIALLILSFFSLNILATENLGNENPSEDTTLSDTASDTTNISESNVTYRPQSSSDNGSSFITSVSPVSSEYEANLGLNNILSILLISIGILLILFSIAILIRIKK